MAKKTRNFLLIIIVVISSVSIAFGLASLKEPAERKAPSDNTVIIPVVEVKNTAISSSIDVLGKISAKERIAIYAEVSGVLETSKKDFLEGVTYKKGETILTINSDEAVQGLISKRSSLLNLVTQVLPELKFDYPESYEQWYQYLVSFDINNKTQTLPTPINDKEKYYITGKGIYQSYYDIVSSETRLAKYTIKAPFDGIVASSNIKPGALVMNGQSLGEFFNPSVYDLETEVSPEDVQLIELGDKVALNDEFSNETYKGEVTRISKNIEQKTQSVKVFVTVTNSDLKDGQYLNGAIKTSRANMAIELPRKLIMEDKYVFTVEGGILKKQEIDLIRNNNSTAIIAGLEDGTLISEKTKNLHEGLKVSVK